eukprot:3940463-Rhodomonas_salina.1
MVVPFRYAMCGNELGYGYAIRCIELAYGAISCYATCGAELAYGAMCCYAKCGAADAGHGGALRHGRCRKSPRDASHQL